MRKNLRLIYLAATVGKVSCQKPKTEVKIKCK